MDTLSSNIVAVKFNPQLFSFTSKSLEKNNSKLSSKIVTMINLSYQQKSKVTLTFLDDYGKRSIRTNIWTHGEKYLCISGGYWIPLNSVLDISV